MTSREAFIQGFLYNVAAFSDLVPARFREAGVAQPWRDGFRAAAQESHARWTKVQAEGGVFFPLERHNAEAAADRAAL